MTADVTRNFGVSKTKGRQFFKLLPYTHFSTLQCSSWDLGHLSKWCKKYQTICIAFSHFYNGTFVLVQPYPPPRGVGILLILTVACWNDQFTSVYSLCSVSLIYFSGFSWRQGHCLSKQPASKWLQSRRKHHCWKCLFLWCHCRQGKGLLSFQWLEWMFL